MVKDEGRGRRVEDGEDEGVSVLLMLRRSKEGSVSLKEIATGSGTRRKIVELIGGIEGTEGTETRNK